MASSDFPGRKRFTVVEIGVVAAIAGLLAGIIVPVVLDKGSGPEQLAAVSEVQEAVRRYEALTGSYPTFPPATRPDQRAVRPWVAGQLPDRASVPAFAGIDFDAVAVRRGTDQRLRFVPDLLGQKPRHADEVAADGTRRWRIDAEGGVSIELDGRSF